MILCAWCCWSVLLSSSVSAGLLGGPSWKVRLGRRDSTTASRALADSVLPSASMGLPALINNFKNQGLNHRDLVALSGGHTIGLLRCSIFRNRIYNATNIDPTFAKERRATCHVSEATLTSLPLTQRLHTSKTW
ncbi:Peroxidase superfamily protein, putative [Theobroma cacao]|uniref:peroxidase n=1 Tax=Theobroma cacao TaxID=3641 RepID=A0A061EQA1_THECC|nr:Peroxidase superfamily protein, putative [Theobroma cacao]